MIKTQLFSCGPCATFTLRVSDIGINRDIAYAGNNANIYMSNDKGVVNGTGSDITWKNVDFIKILGGLYDKYDYFELVPSFFLCPKNAYPNGSSQDRSSCTVFMRGPMFIPSGGRTSISEAKRTGMALFSVSSVANLDATVDGRVIQWRQYQGNESSSINTRIPLTGHRLLFKKPDGPIDVNIYFVNFLTPQNVAQSASIQTFGNWMISFKVIGYKKKKKRKLNVL